MLRADLIVAVELTLVRHGATILAGSALVGGQSNPPLSELGYRQAEALASQLGRVRASGVFVSPLLRALQTAAPLASELRLDPRTVDDLREVHLGLGEAALLSPQERGSFVTSVLKAGRWDIRPGAESMASFGARVTGALKLVATAVGDGHAIVVTHGGVIAEACRQATSSEPLAFLAALGHASITRVTWADGRLFIAGFNDVAHLDAALATR